MELSLLNSDGSSHSATSAILISHEGERVIFPISGTNSFGSTALVKIIANEKGEPYNPFKDINDYMRTLPRRQQLQLFNVYIGINDIINDVTQYSGLREHLAKSFNIIYDIINVDDVEKFMTEKSVIHIPADVESNESTHYKVERTYTPDKYRGLMSLSIALKLALPIWGAYVKYITKGTGVGRKEIHCTRLLKNSSIATSRQYLEFLDFVIHTYNAGKVKTDSIIAGFGTEEQATLLPSACLVRKISVAPNLKNESAVAVAFNYVVKDGPGYERKHPFIKAKVVGGDTLIEERSLLETYQVNESVSPGDLETIAYYCENIPALMKHMCPDVPEVYIVEAEKLRDLLIKVKYKPTLMNIRLTQFFIKEVPPQIIPYLDSEDLLDLMRHSLHEHRREMEDRIKQAENDVIVNQAHIDRLKSAHMCDSTNPEDYRTYAKISLLATLFSILMYKGYPSIALLATAIEVPVDGIDTSIGNSRKQIPSDIDAKLDTIFPLRISGGKDSVNMVKDAISRYFNLFAGRSYKSTYTQFFKEKAKEYEDRDGCHFLRPETPILLAKITIDLYE